MTKPEPSRVPVVPNESTVRGRIVGVRPEPDGHGSVWNVAVAEAHRVGDLPNFAQDRVGGTIHVYAHPQVNLRLTEADEVEARVAFRGDERGGRFVLVGDDARKL
jgi:hypothetical protein